MKTFALVGRNISYSFSRRYFAEKFAQEQITDCEYINFDIPQIEELPSLIHTTPTLVGMNVTIPYKEAVLPLLDWQSEALVAIKACNTIKILPSGELKGYNTDYIGFRDSLVPHLKPYHNRALILGTGGASKAVAFTLSMLEIPYQLVSREATPEAIDYLAERGYDPQFGARPVKRVLQKEVMNALSKEILKGNIKAGSLILIDSFDNGLVFRNKTE